MYGEQLCFHMISQLGGEQGGGGDPREPWAVESQSALSTAVSVSGPDPWVGQLGQETSLLLLSGEGRRRGRGPPHGRGGPPAPSLWGRIADHSSSA